MATLATRREQFTAQLDFAPCLIATLIESECHMTVRAFN